jgi:hypothetical protein
MAGLSIVRLQGIRGSLRVPGEVNLQKYVKVVLGGLAIILTSAAVAITPIISDFENFFVNGIKFADNLKIFIGTQDRQRIHRVLEAYYGRMKNTILSWKMIVRMVRNMFSHDEGYDDYTKLVTKQEFYGNDGVCLFKYFVNKDDPQKEFVWTILIVNFVCFIFISMSYILIGVVSRYSSRNLVNAQNKSHINQRNRNMNRRITIIITTDFCCWVPFIITCALHFLEVLDATPWYSIFSMIVLPINSVINPLLYDDFIARMARGHLHSIYTTLVNSATNQRFNASFRTTNPVTIEMEQKRLQDETGTVASSQQKNESVE